mmetsp:Transcript_48988/g.158289  ORF Transcript_48988/g.158289 Transcript_48988/m.158289 type:complete len:225 (+) Transcript_48988:332-1006(+)
MEPAGTPRKAWWTRSSSFVAMWVCMRPLVKTSPRCRTVSSDDVNEVGPRPRPWSAPRHQWRWKCRLARARAAMTSPGGCRSIRVARSAIVSALLGMLRRRCGRWSRPGFELSCWPSWRRAVRRNRPCWKRSWRPSSARSRRPSRRVWASSSTMWSRSWQRRLSPRPMCRAKWGRLRRRGRRGSRPGRMRLCNPSRGGAMRRRRLGRPCWKRSRRPSRTWAIRPS